MEHLKSNAAEKDAKRQKKEEKKKGMGLQYEVKAMPSRLYRVSGTQGHTRLLLLMLVLFLLIFLFLIISSKDGK